MPRSARQLVQNGIYHVTARGNRRQSIFSSTEDYHCYLGALVSIVKHLSVQPIAHALMPNHVHHIFRDPNNELPALMRDLLGWYARAYNEKYEQSGHLFQGRYYSGLCMSQEQLLAWIRYVHLNPVRASLTDDLRAYPWTSFPLYLNERPSPLIDQETALLFGNNAESFHREFIAFHDIRPAAEQERKEIMLQLHLKEIDIDQAIAAIISTISAQRAKHPKECRQRLISILHHEYLFSTRHIASYFSISNVTVHRMLRREQET